MADFCAVIRRTVDGLDENTPEMRARVYKKAHGAVLRQLTNMIPRPSDEMIARQIEKLVGACIEVEVKITDGNAIVITNFSEARYPLINSSTRTKSMDRCAYLVDLICPLELSEDFIANLSQLHDENWVPRYGKENARKIWKRQCYGLIVHYIFGLIASTVERVRKTIWSF